MIKWVQICCDGVWINNDNDINFCYVTETRDIIGR